MELEVDLSSGEQLLAELRALSSSLDGPPTTLVHVAKRLYALRTLDEELQELLRQAAPTPRPPAPPSRWRRVRVFRPPTIDRWMMVELEQARALAAMR